MRGRAISYSAAEVAFLRAHAATPRKALRDLFAAEFGRPSLTVDQIKSKCQRMGLKTGRTGNFQSGHAPANKGQRGVCHPGSRKTHFKKGAKPHNQKPIGYERLCSKNGYLMIKVAQANPYTGAKTRMMPKHRFLWEAAHGPIPPRHVLRSLDGNPANWALDNWVCISCGVNARLNVAGFGDAPMELRPAMIATARLRDRIGELAPSYVQQYLKRPTTKKHSSAATPAPHLRELLVETSFFYDARQFAEVIDAAIAGAYPDKGWAVDLSDVLPDEPKILHIDWRRLKGRSDLRNRVKQFFPDGIPSTVRPVR